MLGYLPNTHWNCHTSLEKLQNNFNITEVQLNMNNYYQLIKQHNFAFPHVSYILVTSLHLQVYKRLSALSLKLLCLCKQLHLKFTSSYGKAGFTKILEKKIEVVLYMQKLIISRTGLAIFHPLDYKELAEIKVIFPDYSAGKEIYVNSLAKGYNAELHSIASCCVRIVQFNTQV